MLVFMLYSCYSHVILHVIVMILFDIKALLCLIIVFSYSNAHHNFFSFKYILNDLMFFCGLLSLTETH